MTLGKVSQALIMDKLNHHIYSFGAFILSSFNETQMSKSESSLTATFCKPKITTLDDGICVSACTRVSLFYNHHFYYAWIR